MTNRDGAIGPAREIETQVYTELPEKFRRRSTPSEWAAANRRGAAIDSFLEGPCFDSRGNLYVVDIPFGRIFRISPDRSWEIVVEYNGEPNGLAMHPDGRLFIT